MTTHRDIADSSYVLCGTRKLAAHFLGEKFSVINREVDCPDCLKELGQKPEQAPTNNAYENLVIQPWHFAETNNLSFLEGCIIKRICRHGRKGGIEDLDKAIDEIEKLKKHRYNE